MEVDLDVDVEHGTAVIAQQLQRRNGRLQACPLKTAHSARVIALERTTIAALRAHRDVQRAGAEASVSARTERCMPAGDGEEERRGQVPAGQATAFVTVDDRRLLAVTEDGTVYGSGDGGRSIDPIYRAG